MHCQTCAAISCTLSLWPFVGQHGFGAYQSMPMHFRLLRLTMHASGVFRNFIDQFMNGFAFRSVDQCVTAGRVASNMASRLVSASLSPQTSTPIDVA